MKHETASRPKESSSDFVRALAKGLAVIEAFDTRSPSMTLSDVAKKTGLSRGTARRLLLTLVDLGYAGFDGKRFGLQPRALNLGFAYLHSQNLWQLGQPYMVQLVERVHESCSIAVLDRTEIVYVARVPTSVRIMSINLGIGTRLPAFATSMGRVLLAGIPPGEVERLLAQASPLAKYTPEEHRRADGTAAGDRCRAQTRLGAGGPGAGDGAALDRGTHCRCKWTRRGCAEHRDPRLALADPETHARGAAPAQADSGVDFGAAGAGTAESVAKGER